MTDIIEDLKTLVQDLFRSGSSSLKRVGYWKSEEDPSLPDPRRLTGAQYPEPIRLAIVTYLLSGKRLTSYFGYSHCRFNCGIADEDMGNADLNDGVWVWPEGLWHYVSAHDVKLPREFCAHIMSEMRWRRGSE